MGEQMKPYTNDELIKLSGIADDYDRYDWCCEQYILGKLDMDEEGLFCPRKSGGSGMGHDY